MNHRGQTAHTNDDLPPPYDDIMDLDFTTYVNSYTLSPPRPTQMLTTDSRSSRYVLPVRSYILRDVLALQTVLNDPHDHKHVIYLINLLCHRTYHKRLKIAHQYQLKVGRPLVQDLKQCYTSDFGNLLSGLVIPYHEFLAQTIHNSHNFRWLYYILFTISNREIDETKIFFATKYNRTIHDFIKSRFFSETKNHKRIKSISKILEARRSEPSTEYFSESEIEEDLKRLNTITGGFLGGTQQEKDIIRDIFDTKSFNYIKELQSAYSIRYGGNSITSLIEKVFATKSSIYTCMINFAVNRHFYFAQLLKKSVGPWSTDNNLIMHVIVRQAMLGHITEIKSEFQRQNGESLKTFISSSTNGFMKYSLQLLIGETMSTTYYTLVNVK